MKNKNAPSANQSSVLTQQVKCTKIRPPFKIELCIEELLYRGEKGMIELEALQVYGETCLHTTISTLANKHGLIIARKTEAHNHRRGGVTHFTRYTLIDELSVRKANSLLSHYMKRRGVWESAA
jgi:hypothetical protein